MGCCSSQPHETNNSNKRKQFTENNKAHLGKAVAPIVDKNDKVNKEDQRLLNLYNIIRGNPNFTLLLDSTIFDQLFHQVRDVHLSQRTTNALINLLQNYIRYSVKLISLKSLKVEVPYYYNVTEYGHIFGKQIRQIRDNFNTKNNFHIRSLHYFDEFKKLNFDLGQNNKKEIDGLENRVKDLAEDDPLAVFYIVSYLKKVCKKQKNQGMQLEQINKKLKKSVDSINQKFSPNAEYKNDLEQIYRKQKRQIDRLKNQQHEYKKIQFELKEKDKKKQLSKKIVQIAQYAKKQQQILHNLTYLGCIRNEGYGYNLDSKIKDDEDQRAIKRVEEKLLKEQIQKHYKDKKFKSQKIKDLRKQQFKFKKDVMKKVYQNIDKVKFDVTDLLRGRCFFRSLSKINESAIDIINKIKQLKKAGREVQLIQVDNRLQDITNDMVLKIKINQIVTEFQLGLRLSQRQSQIYHKMYEISRSQMLSPLVELYETQRKLTNEFFHVLEQTIKDINETKQVKSEIKNKSNQLKKFIQFKEDHEDHSEQDQIGQSPHNPYQGLYKEQNLVPQKISELKKQKQSRTGDYLVELRTYQQASKYYLRQMQEIHPDDRQIKQNASKKIENMLKLNQVKPSRSLQQINLNL